MEKAPPGGTSSYSRRFVWRLPRRARPLLDVSAARVVDRAEVDDFELTRHRRELEIRRLADRLPEQRAADGRARGAVPFLDLQRGAKHQVIGFARAVLLIFDDPSGAEPDTIVGNLRGVDRR